MKPIQIMILYFATALAFADASAKTVSWAIYPKYDKLVRHYSNIFLFQRNGKWGMVKPGDIEILPASYEYITSFVNGYALAGTKEGSRYLLQAIVNENGEVSTPDEKLYISAKQYFSDGKLVVSNRNGKFGYINHFGKIVIKCQFDEAFPFKDGWAPVKQGNYFKYINETYDRDHSRGILLVDDFHYGDMTLASCFANGRAVIAYNKDLALIGTNGQKIKKLNESEFWRIYNKNNSVPEGKSGFVSSDNYTMICENGLYGLKLGDELIVKPQFNFFQAQFSDGYIIAADKRNKQGLLTVTDGRFTIGIEARSGSKSELEIDRKGNIESIKLNISIPSFHNNLKLLVDCGNGVMQDMTAKTSMSATSGTVSIVPVPYADTENCEINAVLENEGIIVAECSNNFALSYPIKLRVSKPGSDVIQANSDDIAVFSSTVFNDSNKAVEVTATWSTGGDPETRVIPAHGKVVFSSSIKVYENHTRTVRITLNTGESNSREIFFKTFFY